MLSSHLRRYSRVKRVHLAIVNAVDALRQGLFGLCSLQAAITLNYPDYHHARPRSLVSSMRARLAPVFVVVDRTTNRFCLSKVRRTRQSSQDIRLAGPLIMKRRIAVTIHAAISTVALALGLSAGTLRAQTNLVRNGSFEAGPAGEGRFTSWG